MTDAEFKAVEDEIKRSGKEKEFCGKLPAFLPPDTPREKMYDLVALLWRSCKERFGWAKEA